MELKKVLSNNKGLTLIEVLAGIIILMIVLGIGIAALAQSSTLTSEIKNESQERQDMQVGLLQLTEAVQGAKDVVAVDENNFHLINADGSESRFWLDDTQLNTNDTNGLEPIKSITKMTVQNGTGIVFEIEDLEEPVVLAKRASGTAIETGLGEPKEPPMRDADVVCMPGEKFRYDGYPQFGEVVNRNLYNDTDKSIWCDEKNGIITIRNSVNVDLTKGDIRIDTKKIVFDFNAKFSLSNGNLYLPEIDVLSIENHGDLQLPNGSLLVNKNVNLNNNSDILIGKQTNIIGDLNLTGTENNFTAKGDVRVGGNAYFYQHLDVQVGGSFFVDGSLKFNHSSASKFQVGEEIIVKGNAEVGQQFTHKGKGSIFIGGNLLTARESNILSDTNIFINGNLQNGDTSKINSGQSIYINGNLSSLQFSSITANENLVVLGKVTNGQSTKYLTNGSMYINGSLKNEQSSSIHSKGNLIIKGDLTNERAVVLTSDNSTYISGLLKLNSESRMQVNQNLYVQNGVIIATNSRLHVKKDSFINQKISLPPSSSWDAGGAYFYTDGTLTYTGPIEGGRQSQNKHIVLKAGKETKVASINTLPSFPAFPEFPQQPTQP